MARPLISTVAEEINSRALAHSIGTLQELRTELKGLGRQPGNKIFSGQTVFDDNDYAFHHGGRTELQFNIAWEGEDEPFELRHGVAFSLELSQTLKSIDELVPKIKLFNDYVLLSGEEFADMRMWHFTREGRSDDYPVSPIPPELVRAKVFIFLGKRQPGNAIDYDLILRDFDRLLPLYRYVESGGKSQPLSPPGSKGFSFKPGFTPKASSTKATPAARELDVDLRHNALQQTLYQELSAEFGPDNVGTELRSGAGTKVDVVLRTGGDYWFYEIKTGLTPRACLRDAIGQILEYAYWPGAKEPTKLVVCGENAADKEASEYLNTLRERFKLPLEYRQIVIEPNDPLF